MSALIAVAFPVFLVLMLIGPAGMQKWAIRAAPFASLLLLWPLLDRPAFSIPWSLLGVSLQVDASSAALLLLTATAWTLAGWQAQQLIEQNQRWFWSGWLGSLSGMSLLLLAGDMASFYVGYAVLSLSAYLLVTHARSDSAWRAGRVYLVMALLGEAAILAGVCLLAGQLGNTSFQSLADNPDVLLASPARWLLLTGFAVKLGTIPLHFWLPLAHPVAPVPASAILSGIIVKAGLLGCLRLAPPLALDPVWIGQLLLAAGLLTAFGGVLIGLGQTRIKTILAYSTISQMGLILTALSLQFLIPEQREWLLGIIGLMALHHGLNKSALFMACAHSPGQNGWRLLLFALPAISLSAAPLTTGAIAKIALKSAYEEAAMGNVILILLSLSSAATAALMWKAFKLAAAMKGDRPIHLAWPLLVLAAVTLPWLAAMQIDLSLAPDLAKFLDASWPLLVAGALIALIGGSSLARRWRLPEGDGVVLIESALQRLPSVQDQRPERPGKSRRPRSFGEVLTRLEQQQQYLPAAGLAMLLVGALLWAFVQWFGVS